MVGGKTAGASVGRCPFTPLLSFARFLPLRHRHACYFPPHLSNLFSPHLLCQVLAVCRRLSRVSGLRKGCTLAAARNLLIVRFCPIGLPPAIEE